jgi:hypothetical protein
LIACDTLLTAIDEAKKNAPPPCVRNVPAIFDFAKFRRPHARVPLHCALVECRDESAADGPNRLIAGACRRGRNKDRAVDRIDRCAQLALGNQLAPDIGIEVSEHKSQKRRKWRPSKHSAGHCEGRLGL